MPQKVLAIYASPNKEGNSVALGKWFTQSINRENYQLEEVYLYDLRIDYYSGKNYNFNPNSENTEEDVKKLFAQIQAADKVVIATPIWNFGLPAALKNVLDRLSYIGRPWHEDIKARKPAWKKKRFYLLFTTGAPIWGMVFNLIAILQLRLTLKFFGARKRVVGITFKCGNGSKNLVESRNRLKQRIIRKGKKVFR